MTKTGNSSCKRHSPSQKRLRAQRTAQDKILGRYKEGKKGQQKVVEFDVVGTGRLNEKELKLYNAWKDKVKGLIEVDEALPGQKRLYEACVEAETTGKFVKRQPVVDSANNVGEITKDHFEIVMG